MAAPTIIQSDSVIASSVNSVDIVLTGVAAGSTLVTTRGSAFSASRTFTAFDDVDGAHTLAAESGATLRGAGIFYLENSTGGTVTVTTKLNTSSGSWRMTTHEIDASTFDVADSNVGGNTTSHVASSSGVTTSAESLMFVAAATNASSGGFTPGSGYTEYYDADNVFVQHKASVSSIVGEQGAYSTGSSRNTLAAIASFTIAGGAGPTGRIMGSIAGQGGLAGPGGLAGRSGGLAG